MSGKRAKQLRNKARDLTVGMPEAETRRIYKILKSNYKLEKQFPQC
jgi:hypothetical protein